MRATYLALCEHGYADLTVQRIGEEFPKSKSLIYHHYDGKDDLLLDFLSYMLDQYEGAVPLQGGEGADERLAAILDYAFATPLPDERRNFTEAMVELRAQAAHDERYREHFTRHDRFVADQVVTVVERGAEEGVFREGDADAVAQFLLSVLNGAMLQRVTSDAEATAEVRDHLDSYLRTTLLAGE